MKKLILSTTALVMISGSAAFALTDLSTASIVSEFANAQKIDITRGTFRTKVEVVINGVKTEIVYDNATKQEVTRVDAPMTAAEIEATELQLGVDINGDGVIGAPGGTGAGGGLISPVDGSGTGSLISPVDGSGYGLDNSSGDDDDGYGSDDNGNDDDHRGSNRSGSRRNDNRSNSNHNDNHSSGNDSDHNGGHDDDHGNGYDNDD